MHNPLSQVLTFDKLQRSAKMLVFLFCVNQIVDQHLSQKSDVYRRQQPHTRMASQQADARGHFCRQLASSPLRPLVGPTGGTRACCPQPSVRRSLGRPLAVRTLSLRRTATRSTGNLGLGALTTPIRSAQVLGFPTYFLFL